LSERGVNYFSVISQNLLGVTISIPLEEGRGSGLAS